MWYRQKSYFYIRYRQLFLLCIDNTSTYDNEKQTFLLHKGNFITLFNFISAFIHKIIHFTHFISKINS